MQTPHETTRLTAPASSLRISAHAGAVISAVSGVRRASVGGGSAGAVGPAKVVVAALLSVVFALITLIGCDREAAPAAADEKPATGKADADAAARSATGDPPRSVEQLLNEAQAYFNSGEFDESLRLYNQVLELEPDHREALEKRAVAMVDLGRLDEALADRTALLEAEPNAVRYLDRARVHLTAGRLHAVIEDCDRAEQLDAELPQVYEMRGVARSQLGQYTLALADAAEAIAIDPSSYVAYHNRGLVYQQQGLLTRAIEEYTTALTIRPGYGKSLSNRAAAYLAVGKLEEAIADWTQAIHQTPNLAGVYLARGRAYFLLQRYDEALADYATELAQALKRNDGAKQHWAAEAHLRRAELYYHREDIDQAIAECEKALTHRPDDQIARRTLSKLRGLKR